MNLDQRAARASEGLRRAVAESELALLTPVRRKPRGAVLAFASAFAAVLVLVGLLGVQGRWFAEQSDTTVATIVPSTVPVVPPTASTTPTTAPATVTTSTTADTTTTSTVADTIPPEITITSPQPDERFTVKTVLFEGTVEPGAVVTVGRYEAEVIDDRWSIVLVLSPGSNLARITATDAAGNSADATVRVVYDPPEEASEVTFTAFAKYGSCTESPPYDVYYGTAKPDSNVRIYSDYGSGYTYADADGNWEVKVYFKTAPPDEPFIVTVKDVYGEKKYFEFVYKTK
jgi:cytoskeletal protein RodZ